MYFQRHWWIGDAPWYRRAKLCEANSNTYFTISGTFGFLVCTEAGV